MRGETLTVGGTHCCAHTPGHMDFCRLLHTNMLWGCTRGEQLSCTHKGESMVVIQRENTHTHTCRRRTQYLLTEKAVKLYLPSLSQPLFFFLSFFFTSEKNPGRIFTICWHNSIVFLISLATYGCSTILISTRPMRSQRREKNEKDLCPLWRNESSEFDAAGKKHELRSRCSTDSWNQWTVTDLPG